MGPTILAAPFLLLGRELEKAGLAREGRVEGLLEFPPATEE